jgi:hypothetical protein
MSQRWPGCKTDTWGKRRIQMKIPREPWIFAAVVGLSAVVTAGFSWLEAALGWAVCGLIRLILPEPGQRSARRGAAWAKVVFGLLIGTAGMMVAQQAFPEKTAVPTVLVGLSLLLWRSLIGEEDNGQIVGNVLGLVLLVLFGAILLFGLGDVHWEQLIPRTFTLRNTLLTIIITSPWWCLRQNRESWGWFCGAGVLAVGMSLLTGGILGNELASYVGMPLYKTVQTIHVFGTGQRLEALAASGVLVGAFALLLLAGEILREAKAVLAPEQSKKNWYGILCGILFVVAGTCYLIA